MEPEPNAENIPDIGDSRAAVEGLNSTVVRLTHVTIRLQSLSKMIVVLTACSIIMPVISIAMMWVINEERDSIVRDGRESQQVSDPGPHFSSSSSDTARSEYINYRNRIVSAVSMLNSAALFMATMWLIYRFDRVRSSGDLFFQEISDELEWYVRTTRGNDITTKQFHNTTHGARPSIETRIVLREFVQAAQLPLITGANGPLWYFIVNFALLVLNCIVVLIWRGYS